MNLPDISKNYLQQIQHPLLSEKQILLYVLRLDLMHTDWGGNKWFKLKYHVEDALKNNYTSIGSFGGPWSNHLAALASFGIQNNISTIGKVRFNGDYTLYPTLINAKKNGMQLFFLSNEAYESEQLQIINSNNNETYWIPSGGHTPLGVKGCEEILQLPCLQNKLVSFSHIIVPAGNGTTIAGISNSALSSQKIIGTCAIKNGAYLKDEIETFSKKNNIELWLDYHFGGFGKINQTLIDFMNFLNNDLQLPTDKVYTSKMMYAIWDKISNGYFDTGTNILAIHTGGMQGNR